MGYELRQIDAFTHDRFMNHHKKEHFMQSSVWGEIKSLGEWDSELLGLYCDSKLVASVMLLHRRLPLIGGNLYYAPRGFVADFDDSQLISAFTQEIKDYLKNKKAAYFMIDPDYYYQVVDEYDKEIKAPDDFVEKMLSIGYLHRGFTKNFEGSQPRCTFRLALSSDINETTDRFDRFAKKAIRQAEDNCIKVYSSDDFKTFSEIMTETAERDGFIENKSDYYKRVYDRLYPAGMADMLIAKYLPFQHLKSLDMQIQAVEKEIAQAEENLKSRNTPKMQTTLSQAKEKKERLERLRESAEESHLRYPDGIVLSVGLNINTLHRGWTVYGGSRAVLRELNANYAITYAAIKRFTEMGLEFIDFFGTIPDPSEDNPLFGIHRFKKKFSGHYIEFPGEFHLVFDKTRYFIWMTLFPPVFKLLKMVRKYLKK